MPDQTFGGDDDEDGYIEEPQKPKDLHKYGLSPDRNIRDVFWDMMGSYAATKKPGRELSELTNDRFSLIRVAVTVLNNPQSQHYGLTPGFVARYTLMMLLDASWDDAFTEFLQECRDTRGKADSYIASSFKYVWKEEKYQNVAAELFRGMLRARMGAPTALYYIAILKNKQLAALLKRELIILARGDVGENQMNAITALSLFSDDADVIKTFQVLLAHWDAEIRLLAAQNLISHKKDSTIKAAAEKRLGLEQNEDVKKVLAKIAK